MADPSMPVPSPAYLAESRTGDVIATAVVCMVVVVVAVSLRLYARLSSGAGLWWDDWICFVGTPVALAIFIIDIVVTQYGLGRHMAALNPTMLEKFGQLEYAVILFYNPTLAFFKISILALYIRMFPVLRWLKLTCYILSVIVFIWVVSIEFVFIFQCSPISAAWTFQGQCIDQVTICKAQSVPTIFFDLVILFLPVKVVWQLQMKKTLRLGVIIAFLLGGLVTVISVVRLVSVLTTPPIDVTYAYVNVGIWSAAEAAAGLLCCCLITYAPLVRRIRSRFGSGTVDSNGSPQAYGNSQLSTTWRKEAPSRVLSPSGRETDQASDEIQLKGYSSSPSRSPGPEDYDQSRSIHVQHEYKVEADRPALDELELPGYAITRD